MTHRVPIYVYKCDEGHTFEAMQSMSDDPLDTCEVCGAPAHRQLVAPAVHFKGSGFYTTDYARKGAAKSGGNGSGGDGAKSDSGSKSESGSSSSSGSKSEGKAASKD